VPLVGLPISFDGRRPSPRRGPPALGEATAEVLGKTVKATP
jgi:crotonobetainyl-CoA:carnitine CoA-transferase CaiB-like acyl-CoA transferase